MPAMQPVPSGQLLRTECAVVERCGDRDLHVYLPQIVLPA